HGRIPRSYVPVQILALETHCLATAYVMRPESLTAEARLGHEHESRSVISQTGCRNVCQERLAHRVGILKPREGHHHGVESDARDEARFGWVGALADVTLDRDHQTNN